ncbi:glycosyltransferase family 39 protein [Streptomyces sp. NBC_01764]|uniref:ArnT family glycosyltransferase n=1 Tax=Streptomyces sp. NBC_01764 TaxID=2975935 RepID=UPI0022567EC7|nr:glycosyltransferase family 39 protein [Streptomyces sp. NBC_01764]MCX4400580.1 glycosyltransferase family 39 protein [Streptomyces sp. NBC_01764]
MTSATDPLPPAPGPSVAPGVPAAEPTQEPSPTPAAPRWSLPALIAIMVLATVLYSWNLSGSGLNSFYSSAIYSGTQSWKAWFFGSLDAGNFLTVDKPPLALMVMGLSCRIFGFGTWQMMLPMIVAALGTIWILHSSVKRVFGHAAAALAALVLALTPITVAINRDNNPDTLLLLLMVSGAALGLRATRDGRLLPLLGSAVCFGLAFNTKMLQGYIALPAVFAVYLYASHLGWAKRIRNLLLAAVALAVSSFWWATAVSLVPADDRPYIGGSTDGTAWNLIFGYNGLGRVLGGEGNGGGGGGGGGGFSGSAGLGRLFNDILGGQISWLIPFAGIALVGGLVLCGRAPRIDPTRAALALWGGWLLLHYLTFATAEGTMHPYYTTAVAPGIAALCGGGGVMLFRALRGGDVRWSWVLPAGLAVTGIWAVVLLRRATDWNTWLWPTIAVVMALAVVGLFVFRSGNRVRLLAASLAAAVVAALAGPAAYSFAVPASAGGGMGGTNPTAGPSTGNGGFGGGGPGGGRGGFGGGEAPGGTQQGGQNAEAGGQQGDFPGGNGELPQGGGAPGGQEGAPTGGQTGTPPNGTSGRPGGTGGFPGGGAGGGAGGGGGGMGGETSSELISYLEKHQDGAKWLLAVSNSQSAGQLILSTHKPVISMYGFTGTDKGMTVAKLKELVKKGELHYIQVGGSGMGGGMGGNNSTSSAVTAWVQKNATAVKESAYSKSSSSTSSSTSGSSGSSSSTTQTSTLYRLDPSDLN